MPQRTETLSRDEIVRAAIEVCDEEGLAALSLRRIAAKLGAGAASIYWHVANKEALLDLVLDEVYGRVELPDKPSRSWRKEVRDIAHALRRTMLAHPYAMTLVTTRASAGPQALRIVERMSAGLARGGFDGRDLFFAYSVVVTYVLGEVAQEVSWTPPGSESASRPGVDEQAMAAHLEQLTEGRPHVRAMLPHMVGHDQDAQFDFGLEVVIAGLIARAG